MLNSARLFLLRLIGTCVILLVSTTAVLGQEQSVRPGINDSFENRIKGVSSEWVLEHVRAGEEVFTDEIVAAGFRQVEERKDLLKESYFVRFEKVEKP